MTLPIRAAPQGEILGPDDLVTVILVPHPFRVEREVLRLPAGLSLEEIAEGARALRPDVPLRRALVADVGGTPVPRDHWARVRLKPGVTVVLRAVPGRGASSLWRSIAMFAVAILTAFAAPYLTPLLGGFGAAVATAAITVGAGLLINALFPVRIKRDGGQVYSIAGNQNQVPKFQPVPSHLGRVRFWPRYGASPYTEFDGDDQFLRLLYDWGYGPVDLDDLKIGETPLSAFHDVQVEHGYGYPTDGDPTLYPGAVVQEDLNMEVKARDGWTKRSTSEDTIEWALDLVAPNGLSETRKSGKIVTLTVQIEVQQSIAYQEDWQPVEIVTMAAKSNKPIRLTVRRSSARGSHDIRWRRLTPDHDGNMQINSVTAAIALRSYKPFKPQNHRVPHAWTALRIRANAQLQGVISDFNGIVTSRIRNWSGAAWLPDTPSRNPGSLAIHVLQGAANARPVLGSRIIWQTFQAFADHCRLKGYEYNRSHDTKQSTLDACQDVVSAGRGAIAILDGMWSVIWDDPAATIVQHFTPRNSSGFTGRRSYRRLPHAWRILFKNQRRGWKDDEIIYYAPGWSAETATLYEQAEFPGQTDHILNWRHGAYHHAQLRLRPEEYTLKVDIEHLICTRGDRCRVSHFVPGWGAVSGRILGVEGNTVYIDEPLTMEAGKFYCVRVRQETGASLLRDIVTEPGLQDRLTLAGTGDMPADGDLYMAGERTLESVVLRVKRIRPAGELAAEITFVDDAPTLAQADAGAPPDPVSPDPPPGSSDRTPINLRISEGRDAYGTPTVTLLWDTPAGGPPIDHFEVSVKAPGTGAFGSPVIVASGQRSRTWDDLAAGETGFRVRTLYTDGTSSLSAEITATIVGDTAIPPDVTGLTVAVIGGAAIFAWDAPDVYVDRLELRYSPATSGASWAASTFKASRAGGTTLSVPYAAGTYFAAFVTGAGVTSATPVALVVTAAAASTSTLAGEIFDMAPFGGSDDGTVEADGGLRLAYGSDGALVAEGTYEPIERIDLGAVYLVRVAAEVLAHGVDKSAGASSADIAGVDPRDWEVTLEVSTTNDDPASSLATWSPWSPASDGMVEARAFKVRVRLARYEDAISPVVELIHLRADFDARSEFGAAFPVPSSGAIIAFAPPFRSAPAIQVTGRDFESGDRIEWGPRSAGSASIRILTSAGSPVARSIDWAAAGYGRRVS